MPLSGTFQPVLSLFDGMAPIPPLSTFKPFSCCIGEYSHRTARAHLRHPLFPFSDEEKQPELDKRLSTITYSILVVAQSSSARTVPCWSKVSVRALSRRFSDIPQSLGPKRGTKRFSKRAR